MNTQTNTRHSAIRIPHSAFGILHYYTLFIIHATLALAALCAASAPKEPPVPLKPAGQILPRASIDGASPRIGIGFEKLDRDVFDPEKAYDKVAAIGVKWVRIQSGWQRTEKVRGQYDFAWLDSIVDNLIKRGMTPWMCLCYGNELHTPEAAKVFGAVGVPPINSDEALQAWLAYVTATVKHFKGRIGLYEIWNEPDGRSCWKPIKGGNPVQYANFAIATSKAIRAADPAATIAAGSLRRLNMAFTTGALNAGLGAHIDALTYHCYVTTELDYPGKFEGLKALVLSYNPKIKFIQGESGAQSRADGKGALRNYPWTPRKQAKLLLRHLVTDLGLGVEFTSYFSSLDMIEALNGKVGDKSTYLDYGYFGVLGADFDADGRATGEYIPKPSYHALQNLCAALTADVELDTLPLQLVTDDESAAAQQASAEKPRPTLQLHGFKKANGARALAFWDAADLATDCTGSLSLVFSNLPRPVRLVDLMTGVVYDIPDSMLVRMKMSETCTLKNLRLADYPCLLTFGDFAPFEPVAKPAAE